MPITDLPALAFGANDTLPPGAMAAGPMDGALWRELRNLRPHDGALRPREALQPLSFTLPTFPDNEPQDVLLFERLAEGELSDAGESPLLMVTSRDIFWHGGGSWQCVTPYYSDGTVSITNGTTALNGVGTAWQTHRIAPNQRLELPEGSGNFYLISTVNSNTSITLATAFTGTTLAGANYRAYQTFSMAQTGFSLAVRNVFYAELNGDCFLAGPFGQRSSVAASPDGAVIFLGQAANPNATSVAPAWLTSGAHPMGPGVDNIGDFFIVRGMQLLPDGRIVLTVQWEDSGLTDAGVSRLLYSSHLTPTVWTTSPAGFADPTQHDAATTALTKGSRALHVHYLDGIDIATFTGDDDPPLSIASSRAHVGALAPGLIQSVAGGALAAAGEVFIAPDRKLYRFSGDVATPFNEAANTILAVQDPRYMWSTGFSRYSSYRREVCFAWAFVGAGNSARTLEMRVPLGGDSVYEASYPAHFYCAFGGEYQQSRDRPESVDVFGMSRFDRSGSATNLLYELREDFTADSVPDNSVIGTGVATVAPTALSDFLLPAPMGEMAPLEIVVWVWPTATGSGTLTVNIKRDGVSTALTPSITSFTSGKLVPVRFLFEPAPASAQVQFEIDNSAKLGRIVRVQIFSLDAGTRRAA